jgi:hypothetical protein
MPDSTLPQSLLQLHLEQTPSPRDPKDAPELYQALGIATVAIGRLENHFLGCVINILGLLQTTHLAKRLPMAFNERVKIWNRAFEISTELNPIKTVSLDFARELVNLAEDRAIIAHGQWGSFDAGPPLGIRVTILSHKDATQYGLDIHQGILTLSKILTIAEVSNRLNL